MRETHIISLDEYGEGDGKYLIYRPLRALAFVGNRATANLIREFDEWGSRAERFPEDRSSIYRFLSEIGFFCEDTYPDERTDTDVTTAVLLLTNRCQLRCTYCYAAAGDLSPKALTFETGKAVIDFVSARASELGRRMYRLEFHGGGEPTIEWDVLTRLVEYARSTPVKADISITSNAVWSDRQCAWLIEHMDSLSVSMDGDEATQNANRPLASGEPSFSIVLKNLKRLDESGARYGIRMTAAEPWDHLVQNIEFIAGATQCRRVQVEPAFSPLRGNHGEGTHSDYAEFVDAFKAAYLVARKHNVHLRYSSARVGQVTRQFCSAPYKALVANPDGELVACYEVTNRTHPLGELSNFGRVEGGKVNLDEENRANLHALMADRWQHCKACFCCWSCAGDCYVRAFKAGKDGHLVYGERCAMNQKLTIFLLLQNIADHGGVWSAFGPAAGRMEDGYG